MDICEFAEKVYGVKLLEYHKQLLKQFADLPEGSTIVMGRKGLILLDKDGRVISREELTKRTREKLLL